MYHCKQCKYEHESKNDTKSSHVACPLKKWRKIGWFLVPHNIRIRMGQKWLKKKQMQPFVLQSHMGEQNSSTGGPLRCKGGSLHKACVTFTQKKAV